MAAEHTLRLAGVFLLSISLQTVTSPATGQQAGAIEGRVYLPERGGFANTHARISALRRQAEVGADGTFRFEEVPPGEYVVEVSSPTYGSGLVLAEVPAGGRVEVGVVLQASHHLEEVVVTASPDASLEVAVPASVLRGDDLANRIQPTLGETLSSEAGISSTYFGPGASRPVIRGLQGDRVRMLQGGIGSLDAASLSPDHAVTVEPLVAERIEILRGASSLLYGSSAIGGVVNVVDGRIPSFPPDRPIHGKLELGFSSVSEETRGVVELDGGSERWAWHLDASARSGGEVDIPGFSRLGDEGADGHEENPFGVLPNTDLETESAAAGLSYFVGADGFVGVSMSGFDSNYGIPFGLEEGEAHDGEGEPAEEGDEEGIRIDLEQRRLDLRGEVTRPFSVFRGLRLRLGLSDYEHAELEGEEVGTRFFNDAAEGRIELVQKPTGRLSGSFGLQAATRDLRAAGAEAFVPETESETLALFALEELEAGPLRWQVGLRYEEADQNPARDDLPDRSFDGLSASAGLIWRSPAEGWGLSATLQRSSKFPASEELYSDGPHVATQSFEIGNPLLEEETGLGLDLSLKKRTGVVSGELNLFRTEFDDYIYAPFTGDVEDGFPVVRYTQADAEFTGAELQIRVELLDREPHHLHLRLVGDRVEAELQQSGVKLPRIPPLSAGAGLHYHGDRWNGMAEVRWVDRQTDVAPNETPTEGYVLLNASVGYRFVFAHQVFDLLLRGRNLTDEEARNHVSFLKDVAPLPGRDVGLSLRFLF